MQESPNIIEDINLSLKDNYECTFKEYFGLLNIIYPHKSCITDYELEKYYNNPNIIVLIIEQMCLAIVMPYHLAIKFKYIDNIIKYKDYYVIYEEGMKIIKISNEWNINKWRYTKILNFYNWIIQIENKSCEELELETVQKKEDITYINPVFDINFLNALCWNHDINEF